MLTSSSVVCVERPKDTFGARLKAARERKGISQPILADMVKVSPMMISRYERDQVRDPNTSIVMKICEALGLESPEELGFTGEGERVRSLKLVPPEPPSPREWALNPKGWPKHFFELHGYAEPDQIAAMAEEMAKEYSGVENIDVQHARFWISARRREDDAREAAKKKLPARHRSRGGSD